MTYKYLNNARIYNIFLLDENKDEPTFTNEKGKFFLVDKLKNPERRKTIFVFKAVLFDGEKKFLLSDGKEWLREFERYEEAVCSANILLFVLNSNKK